MIETMDTPALAGARRGDCLVEAFVMAVFSYLLPYTVDNDEH
jgi:hypothetical protein